MAAFFLISNKHVFGDAKSSINLNFHELKEKGVPNLDKIRKVRFTNYERHLHVHPDPEVDLAALNISSLVSEDIYFTNLELSFLPTFNEPDLFAGNEVWFVGYPENRFDTAHNLPLVRRGYISSAPKVDFNNKKEFLIDAHVHRGSSGSPVFSSLQGKYMLLGVVTETMIINSQIQAIPAHTNYGVQQTMGLGIVIKAERIRQLLDSAMSKILPKI